jgi:phage terminase large subunit-like protein
MPNMMARCPHDFPSVVGERPRLLKDGVRHADLADVVQERPAPHCSHFSGATFRRATSCMVSRTTRSVGPLVSLSRISSACMVEQVDGLGQ